MSCVRITTGRPRTGRVTVRDMARGAALSVKAQERADIGVGLQKPAGIQATAQSPARIGVRLTCRVGRNKFLYVTPTETMWITVDDSINYDITSNTDWTIE